MDSYDKARKQAERVLHWNLERNGLELFPSLEHQMLTEEEQEFTEAVFTWDTLREYADYLFVYMGTVFKTTNQIDQLKSFLDMWENRGHVMEDRLYQMLRDYGLSITQMDALVSDVLDIIIDANETKGFTLENGKVPKGENYSDPISLIQAKMKEYILENRADD